MIKTYGLKILPQYFKDVWNGRKTFEIRRNNGGFEVGDWLVLREWNGKEFTGSIITKQITYITDYEQRPGYIVMSIK
ncbi:DUF3850 domain-containing protein [Rummeliibacillus sp. JY-2-4R]